MKKIGKKLNLGMTISLIVAAILLAVIFIFAEISVKEGSNTARGITNEKLSAGVNGISSSTYYKVDAADKELLIYSENKDLVKLLQSPIEDVKAKKEGIVSLVDQFNNRFKGDVDSKSMILNEYVMNKDGIICSSVFPDAVGSDCSERQYFKRAMNGEDLVVDDVVYSDRLSSNVTMISKPIKDGDKIIGVVTAVLDISFYEEIFEEHKNEGLDGFIIDNSGNFIYNSDEALIGKSIDELKIDTLKLNSLKESGQVDYKYKNEDYIAQYKTIPGLGWKVFVSGRSKDVLAGVTKLKSKLLLISVILFAISIAAVYFFANLIAKPIASLTKQAGIIADGDLTIKIDSHSRIREIGELSDAFNKMVYELSGLINQTVSTIDSLQNASSDLVATSEEVTASNGEINNQVAVIAENAVNQAEQIQTTSDKTIELGNSIENLEQKNKKMNRQSNNVIESLNESSSKVEYLVETNVQSLQSFGAVKDTVEQLIAESSKIAEAMGIIEDISDQTSLLALNASIEAARAGEAGKSFAVVASEISALSDEVKKAVDDVSANIQKISETVNVTKKTIADSEKMNSGQADAFNNVNQSFGLMSESLNEMITITREIGSDIDNITRKKNEVLNIIEDVASKAQEVASSTEEVSESVDEQSKAFENVSRNAEELTGMSDDVKKLVERFKVN